MVPAEVMAIPFWSMAGRMVGALAVAKRTQRIGPQRRMGDSMQPLEALAVRLARTMENVALAERLLRAEKLAGLGQLAGGVAHALNNPLTAVLGFAELIAESSDEPRVQAGRGDDCAGGAADAGDGAEFDDVLEAGGGQ